MFLLAGVGAIINALAGRLGRIIDRARVLDLFRALEFRSLPERLPPQAATPAPPGEAPETPAATRPGRC